MKITINKKEDGTVVFIYNEKEREFSYEDLDDFIDNVYNTSDEILYTAEEGLEEYKELLNEIVTESRKQDYIDAVEEAKKSSQAVKEQE